MSDAFAGPRTGPVLYVASRFPAVSETFVHREILSVRQAGVDVAVATLRRPAADTHSAALAARLGPPVQVYGSGAVALLAATIAEALRHPIRAVRTALLGARDALVSKDLTLRGRCVVPLQVLAAIATAHRVRRLGVRHVHAHMANAPTTVAMYLATQLQVPFSFTGHANDVFVDRSLLGEKLERAAFVACISEWHREFYRSIVALPETRAPIVRCGVDVEGAARRHADGAPLQLVGVGRLVPKKGFHVLVEAVAKLQLGGTAVSVTIVGEGPERENLATQVAALPDAGAVRMAGALPHASVLDIVRSSDVFVLPCVVDPATGDKDGIPVALMEAMAAGLAVVSGDLPAIRELVEEGRTGRMVPSGDAAALAAAIADLADDAALRTRLGGAAREWVEREFSTSVNTRRLLGAFSSAARSGRATATCEVSAEADALAARRAADTPDCPANP